MSVLRLSDFYKPRDASPSDYYGWAPRKASIGRYDAIETDGDPTGNLPWESNLLSGHSMNINIPPQNGQIRKEIDGRNIHAYRECQNGLLAAIDRDDRVFMETDEHAYGETTYRNGTNGKGKLMLGGWGYHQNDVSGSEDSMGIHAFVPSRSIDKSVPRNIKKGSKKPLAGLIFMCNNRIRKSCFRHGVFGMPLAKKDLVDQVIPTTKLFLFEFESRKLWGIYEATTYSGIDLERDAYRVSEVPFPAQVRFRVYKKCEPLQERDFSEAIKENYFRPTKFSFELTEDQVLKLIQLFCHRECKFVGVDDSAPKFLPIARTPDYSRVHMPSEDVDCYRFERDSTRRKGVFDSNIHNRCYHKEDSKSLPVPILDYSVGKGGRCFVDSITEDELMSGYSAQYRVGCSCSDKQVKQQFARESLTAGLESLPLERTSISCLECVLNGDSDLLDTYHREKLLKCTCFSNGVDRKGELHDHMQDLQCRQVESNDDIFRISRKENGLVDDICHYTYRRQGSNCCPEKECIFSYKTSERPCDTDYYEEAEDRLDRDKHWVTKDGFLEQTSSGNGVPFVPMSPLSARQMFPDNSSVQYNTNELYNSNAKYSSLSSVTNEVDAMSSVPYSSLVTTENNSYKLTNWYNASNNIVCHKGKSENDCSRKTDHVMEKTVQIPVMRHSRKSSRSERVADSKGFLHQNSLEDTSGAWKPHIYDGNKSQKRSVWSRLSGPAKLMNDRDPRLSKRESFYVSSIPREFVVKERKCSQAWLEQDMPESDFDPNDGRWEEASNTILADPLEENVVIDFKRRRNTNDRNVDVQSGVAKSEMTNEGSGDPPKENGDQKGRRKLIRPQLIANISDHTEQLTQFISGTEQVQPAEKTVLS
eukprot:c27939_g1_i1 orf=901-3516(-)